MAYSVIMQSTEGQALVVYTQTYDKLYAYSLTPEQHERTCGYWFTVTNGAIAHTAFASRAGLDRWLAERSLSLENELPGAGTSGSARIVGGYRKAMHGDRRGDDLAAGMGPGDFYSLHPVLMTVVRSNGDYTLALVTEEEEDGIRTVHTLNPNVVARPVFDRTHITEWLAS
jgi:hypothetical protein